MEFPLWNPENPRGVIDKLLTVHMGERRSTIESYMTMIMNTRSITDVDILHVIYQLIFLLLMFLNDDDVCDRWVLRRLWIECESVNDQFPCDTYRHVREHILLMVESNSAWSDLPFQSDPIWDDDDIPMQD